MLLEPGKGLFTNFVASLIIALLTVLLGVSTSFCFATGLEGLVGYDPLVVYMYGCVYSCTFYKICKIWYYPLVVFMYGCMYSCIVHVHSTRYVHVYIPLRKYNDV